MKRVENITVDVKNCEYDEIKLKQMDTTQIVFKMLDNSKEMDLTETQARIIFTKPNQTIVIQNAVINGDKKSIIADLKEDCVRSYGRGKIEVEILKDKEVLSSFQLNVRIEKTSKENLASSDTPNYFEELEDALSGFKQNSFKLLEGIEKAEQTRVSNENSRVVAEETRASNENTRTSQEESRVETEQGRVEAEKLRVKAEAERAKKISEMDTAIEKLKEENGRLREDINALATGQAEGENITIDNSTEARFKEFGISGNDWQETDDTKPSPEFSSEIRNCGDNVNLFDKDSVKMVSGSNVKYETLSTGIKVINIAGGTGARPCEFKTFDVSNFIGESFVVKMKFNANGENKALVLLYLCNEDNSAHKSIAGTPNTASAGTGEFELYATIPEEAKTMPYLKLILYGNYNGTAITNDYVEYTDIKIEQGTKATPYSPYGCGNVNFGTTNANLFDLNLDTLQPSNCTYTIEGKKIILTATKDSNIALVTHLKKELPIGTYTLNSTSKICDATIFTTIDNKTSTINFGGAYECVTKTSTDITGIVSFNWVNHEMNTQFILDLNNIMLLKGSYTKDTIPPYVSPEYQLISFPTKEGQVFHKGDYLADNGIHQTRKTIELTGDETIVKIWEGDNCHHCFKINNPLLDSEIHETRTTDILCQSTHFVGTYYDAGSESIWAKRRDDTDKPYLIAITDWKDTKTVGYIYIKHSDITTVEEMQTFLREQKEKGTPVMVEYKLQDEIIEPYSPEQKKVYEQIKNLRGYNGTTHIFSEDEIKPYIKVEYLKNQDIEHQKLQSQIDEIKKLLSTSSTSAMLLDNLEKDLIEEV